jgi:hypothetical protein
MGQTAPEQFIALVLTLPFGMLLATALLEGYATARTRGRELSAAGLLLLGAACLFALLSVAVSAALVSADKAPTASLYTAACSAALVAIALAFKLRCLKAKAFDRKGKKRKLRHPGLVGGYRAALILAFLSFVIVPLIFSPPEELGTRVAAVSPSETASSVPSQPSPPAPEPEPEPAVAAIPEPAPEAVPPAPIPEPAVVASVTPPVPVVEPPAVIPAAPVEPPVAPPVVPAVVFAEATPEMFSKLIVPIFKDRCIDCHGEKKQKGDLRMDTPEWIRKGGKSGPLLVAGLPQESHIYELISLESDDEDIMPSKGKPLTERQIAFIRRWILEGAGMDDGEEWPVSATASATIANTGFGIDALAASVAAPDATTVKALEDKGVYVRQLSANGALLELDFSHADLPAGEMGLDGLAPIAANIYTLDLKRTRVSDADLRALLPMVNLRKLHLQRTGVTDAGLSHLAGLAQLEVINLYSTSIGDQGVKHLEGLKSLKEVYLFETEVSTAGALSLRAAVPLAKVSLGAD